MLASKREVSLDSWRYYSSQCLFNRCSQYWEKVGLFFLSVSKANCDQMCSHANSGVELVIMVTFKNEETHELGFFPGLAHWGCNRASCIVSPVGAGREWLDCWNNLKLIGKCLPLCSVIFKFVFIQSPPYECSSGCKAIACMVKLQKSYCGTW